ncbi:MAG: DUF7347 domain-containing protein [Candidatus Kariarchaeaceae archaeon]
MITNETDFEFISEDEVFTILAHPTRRKILSKLFENNSLSFSTTLSKDWGMATGTIYHHLKALDQLIDHNAMQTYSLNDNGVKICEWFLGTKSRKAKVERMNAFTALTSRFYDYLDLYPIAFLLLTLGIILSGQIVALDLDIMIMGPLILPFPERIDPDWLWLINLGSLAIFFVLFTASLFVTSQKLRFSKGLLVFLTALTPTYFIILLIYAGNQNDLTIGLLMWILITIFTQLTFLVLSSTAIVVYYGSSIERSVLIAFSLLYLFLFVSLPFV